MTPTRLLVWQFLFSLLLIAGFIWAATQWTANALGFQPGLGAPWFTLYDTPIYKPWRFFQWWYVYDAYAPSIFFRGGSIVAFGGIAAFASAVAGSLLRARQSKNVVTYGSARWGTAQDARSAALLAARGAIVGTFEGKYLRHDGPEHILTFAPTRSGKGVGLVIPTLLSWGASVIIHDIKGENWSLTSKHRSTFSKCIRFDPTRMDSHRFNPLLEVRKGQNEVRDAQNIAEMIIDPDGALNRKEHWDRTAFKLITAAILHVLYAEEEKTLARVASLLTEPGRTIDEILETMMTTNHIGTDKNPQVHPEVAKGAKELEIKPEKEQASVISTTLGYFAIYADPLVQNATRASDFTIDDLIHGEQPLSLYLAIPPSDLIRTRPLMRLILNQIVSRMMQEAPSTERQRHRVLLMLDEFPALGRLETFEMELAFMASYGLKAVLIAQSLNQLDKAYGQNNSILDNCHIRVAFATNDERTAKRISEMLGTKTEQRHQRSYTGHRLSVWLGHVMVSQQETQRPLLTPGEVMQLDSDKSLILASGSPPLFADKLRYFKDGNFKRLTGELKSKAQSESNKPRSQWSGCIRTSHADLVDELGRDRAKPANGREIDGSGPRDEAAKPNMHHTLDSVEKDQADKLLRQARFMAMSRQDEDER